MVSVDNATKFLKAFEEKFGEDYTTFAMAVVPAVPLGCSWGFFSDKQFKEFNVEKNTLPEGVLAYQVNGGWLIYVDYNTLVSRLQEVAPIFTPETFQSSVEHRLKSQENLDKMLAKAATNGLSPVRLGIFSVNESPTITIKGKSYPAYNVDLGVFCKLAEKYGYKVQIGDKVLDAQQLLSYAEEALRFCNLAPSSNALLIQLVK